MEINVRDDQQLVEIWLTRGERDDDVLQERLKPIYRDYHNQKYLVAVYCSGDQDLYQQTSNLLCYNRKRIAEMEVKQEETPQEIEMSL